jgi:hypothetical protein
MYYMYVVLNSSPWMSEMVCKFNEISRSANSFISKLRKNSDTAQTTFFSRTDDTDPVKTDSDPELSDWFLIYILYV